MILTAFVIALIVVSLSIGIYYSVTGIWPGGRTILENPAAGVSGLSENEAKFMFFSTEWCPYSQRAKDPWMSFKQELLNTSKTYGGKTIIFEEIDCDAQKGKAAMFGVREYPTFKLQTKTQVFKMCGNPSTTAFKDFLKSSLGNEST